MPEEDADPKSILVSIRELKEQDPFEPFEIKMTSGDGYLIEADGNLVEMKDRFFYAFPGGDHWAWIRYNQIAALEGYLPKKRQPRKRSF